MGNPPAMAVRPRYHRELALTDVVVRHVVFSDAPSQILTRGSNWLDFFHVGCTAYLADTLRLPGPNNLRMPWLVHLSYPFLRKSDIAQSVALD